MGCFSVQKNRKKFPEQQAQPDLEGLDEMEKQTTDYARPSFRSKVRVIQHAQRFINNYPKLSSSQPSYATRSDRDGQEDAAPITGHTRSSMEFGSALCDVATVSFPLDNAVFSSLPLPLPSAASFANHSCHRLPRPHEHVNFSAPISSLPLPNNPLNPSLSAGKHFSSITAPIASPTNFHTSDPQPLPPPRDGLPGLRIFSYEELAAACQNFSRERCVGEDTAFPAYTGIIKSESKREKHMDVTVFGLCERWQQDYREWRGELSTVVRLHGPHLCKILGFYAGEETTYRLLVYERFPKGNLDKLLYRRADSPPLDWTSRAKIAVSAAQGLACLHEKASDKIMYRDFRTSNIDVDMDFSSKLSGYAFAHCSRAEGDNPATEAYCAPETIDRGIVTTKSNVWSFGVILLEILTGRQNMDMSAPRDERNLVKWARPFLTDEGRLFLIMDPKLQGRFPTNGAMLIADLALQCLQMDPTKRPTMREATEVLKLVQEMRYRSRFPLREPTTMRQSTIQFDLVEGPQLKALVIPSRSCATSFAIMEEVMTTRDREHCAGRGLKGLESF